MRAKVSLVLSVEEGEEAPAALKEPIELKFGDEFCSTRESADGQSLLFDAEFRSGSRLGQSILTQLAGALLGKQK